MWRIWLAALFWGLNWPAVKIALGGLSPLVLRTVGLGLGAALLAALAKLLGRSLVVSRHHWPAMVIGGLFSIVGFNIAVIYAQVLMPTSRAAILTFTMPLWTVLFSYLFLAERVDRIRALALGLGAAGIAVLSRPFWPQIAAGELPLGLVCVLAAAMSWAAGSVYLKARSIPVDPVAMTVWQLFIAAVACGLAMAAFETPRLDLSHPPVLWAMIFHVIFPIGLSYLLWFDLLGRVSSATASLGTLLVPIFGVMGSVAMLDAIDHPSPSDMLGFGLLLVAVLTDQVLRPQASVVK